ncbi:YceI family protein [Fontivita pretiosa]|uniref:YceI family protein n=1 Tax=Fontivita pretiosa TaxID=2989684 RepID=UPI003D169A98
MTRLCATVAMVIGLIAWISPLHAADTYKIDPVHSFVVFKIGHLEVGYVWGTFPGPTGSFVIDTGNPAASSLEVHVKAESVHTANDSRDKHLRSPDFFDARQFPTISFKSDSVKQIDENTYELSGQLSLHGVTRPLTVTLKKVGQGDKGPQFGYRAGYDTQFTIKRSDFGMKTMPQAVGDEVTVFVSFEAVRQ